jgi:hypothetical protein
MLGDLLTRELILLLRFFVIHLVVWRSIFTLLRFTFIASLIVQR